MNNDPGSSNPERPDDCPDCPICDGRMEKVYDRHHHQVYVCVDCHTGLTIPAAARHIASLKRSDHSA